MLRDYDDSNCCPSNTQISPSFNEQEVAKAEKLQIRHGLKVLDASGNDLRVTINLFALLFNYFLLLISLLYRAVFNILRRLCIVIKV